MMLPRTRPCPDQFAGVQGTAPIVRGFGDVRPPGGCLGLSRKHRHVPWRNRYLGRAWANFRSFGGPKSRNANEAHCRTPIDVTGCAAESRPELTARTQCRSQRALRKETRGPSSPPRSAQMVNKSGRSRAHFRIPKMGTTKGLNFGTSLHAVKRA
eukprot:5898716-Alexandrium_andersonii.AAC.1